MKWLYNKTDNHTQDLMPTQADRISYLLKAKQRKLADYLQQKTGKIPDKTKWISLLCFCVLFGGCSISIFLYASFRTQPFPVMHRITIPKYSLQPSPLPMQSDSLILKSDYERINHVRQHLVELQKDSSGKKRYDSLMQARPHLLDSIYIIDSLFQAQ